MSQDEPFGRQPQPVKVTFEGDPRDVDHYLRKLQGYIERTSYDLATRTGPSSFTISPRAVND